MAESKYGKYICTELKKNIDLPVYREWEKDIIGQGKQKGFRRGMEHVVWTDAEVMPGAFYSECVWLWPSTFPDQMPRPAMTPEQMKNAGVPPHAHPFPELLSFFGTDMEHPEELYGEVEFWLEDEKFILDKSFVVYIPAGMTHCPLRTLRNERGFFHFTIGPGEMYV
jgi:hypothetical protein